MSPYREPGRHPEEARPRSASSPQSVVLRLWIATLAAVLFAAFAVPSAHVGPGELLIVFVILSLLLFAERVAEVGHQALAAVAVWWRGE